jgi:uncharacterized protein with HEPN domain
MSKDYRIHINDIINEIDETLSFIEGLSFEQYEQD